MEKLKDNKVGIITGANSGIGQAISEYLEDQNNIIIKADKSFECTSLDKNQIKCDLTIEEENKLIIEKTIEKYGKIDFIIPNAGFQHVSPIENFCESKFTDIQSILLKSPFLLAKYSWLELQKTNGTIVIIASAHGLVASPYKTAYNSAKHGAVGLAKTLALEGAECGIRVNAVCPGVVRTPLVEKQLVDQAKSYDIEVEEVLDKVMLAPHAVKRLIEPIEIAKVVNFLISDNASAITGIALPVDLGWTAR